MADASTNAVPMSSLSSGFWLGKLDLRPLALFRIAFALFIAYDLLDLLPNATTFFSDLGVMPRHALMSEMVRWNRFALSDVVGSPEAVYVYWACAFTACMAVVAGYRTRIAQVVLYLFLAGFNERLPELFDGSDSVIRLTLFWLCFCESGNRYSVDALLAEVRGAPKPTVGLALPVRIVQAQIAWVYLCSFLHKTGGATWLNGSALHYVLHLNHVFARPWAALVADYPLPMAVGTYFTLVFECGFALLVFSPFLHKPLKALALLCGLALHGGIALTVNVGLFSYLMPLTYLVFFEPEWTEWLIDRLRPLTGQGKTTVLYDGQCPVCARGAVALRRMDRFGNLELVDAKKGPLPASAKEHKGKLDGRLLVITPAGEAATGLRGVALALDRFPATFVLGRLLRLPLLAQVLGALFAAASEQRHALARQQGLAPEIVPQKPAPRLLAERWRLAGRDLGLAALVALFLSAAWYAAPQPGRRYLPLFAEQTVQWFSLWNVWDMFSPEPLRTDYHLRVIAEYDDGHRDDLFGGPVNGPGEVRGFFFTRWWKYLENVTGGRQVMPREWANWQCRNHSWNVPPGQPRVWQLTLKKENQVIPPIGQPWPPVEVVDVWNWRCFEKPPAPAAVAPPPPLEQAQSKALVVPPLTASP